MSCCGLTSFGAIPHFVFCFSVHWWGTRRIAWPILWRRNWKSALQSFKSGQKCLTIFCVTVCDFYCIDKRNVMLLKRTYFWLFPSFSSRTVVFRAVNIVWNHKLLVPERLGALPISYCSLCLVFCNNKIFTNIWLDISLAHYSCRPK